MSDTTDPTNNLSGGNTLGGGPAEPLPASWNRSGQAPRIGRIGATTSTSSTSRGGSSSRFATLRDITSSSAPLGGFGGGGSGGGGDHMSDDEDDDGAEGSDAGAGENWYAGGERSGLSVENPDRSGPHIVRDILRKAAEAAVAPRPATASAGLFRGSGYLLGSDEVESRFIPDPNAEDEAGDDQEVAIRHITFWRDGFNVEDGPLMRYDQQGNSQLLDEINAGNAPPQFLNVRVGQPVELRVTRRLNEDYIPLPSRPIAAFEGQGHRLGAAVPSISSSSAEPSVPGAFPSTTSSPPREDSTIMKFQVDQSLPTTSVQVRLADGTRLVARMNLHHTIGDIRNFINASRPGSSSAPYTIQTPHPARVLDDDSVSIEQAGLKNSVVIQRMV